MSLEFVGLTVMVLVLFASLLSVIGLVATQLVLTSLARDAARAASVQEDATSAAAAARGVASRVEGVSSSMTSDGSFVTITLRRDVRIARIEHAFAVTASSSALEESPW